MMRVLCTVAALIMVATTVFAGTESKLKGMTPEQAMEKMANCPVCSVWFTEPNLGQNVRYNVFNTKNGYVETFMNADASLQPAFEKTSAECEKRMAAVPTMADDQKAKLCPLCKGHMAFMGRSDVTVEHFKTDTGFVTVATANTPDGVKALQEYAATSKGFNELMAKAGKEKSKEPMKSKM